MSTIKDFMLSSTPALTSQVRIQDTASFLKDFAKFFEGNNKTKLKRELEFDQYSFEQSSKTLGKFYQSTLLGYPTCTPT